MPILSGIFKSNEKNTNQVASELSNENIKTVLVDDLNSVYIKEKKLSNNNREPKEKSKEEKALLTELISLSKSKKSSTCFQLHSYDNVYIRRVIHPIKEEPPTKLERRKSLKNDFFKNLRINTILSNIKGSLNSAPVKEDNDSSKNNNYINNNNNNDNKNLLKNGPKTAAVGGIGHEKSFDYEKFKIEEKNENEEKEDDDDDIKKINHNKLYSNQSTNNCNISNNSFNSSNNIISYSSSYIGLKNEQNQSLNTLSKESLKSLKNISSTPSVFSSNEHNINSTNSNNNVNNDDDDNKRINDNNNNHNVTFYSDDQLQKKKSNKKDLTIDTSQNIKDSNNKKKNLLSSIITPSSKSLPWIKEKKKNKKKETVSANVVNNENDITTPLIDTKSQSRSVPCTGISLNSSSNLNTSNTILPVNGSSDYFQSDIDENAILTPSTAITTPSTANSSTSESSSKISKKKKIHFSKEGLIIGNAEATDVRIISKMYNEDKDDFHKRMEFDFICTELRKNKSDNHYFYNPTDLIYNNSKAFFFYRPTITIGSLKDILKNSKGFKDEMDIYIEEMLCTFKKLVDAVHWLNVNYQVVHRRIEPNRILFDTSGQFKLTGLEWAFHLNNHDSINVQEEYNFHNSLVHVLNNLEKNDPIFFAPELCELNSDYFSKLSTKIDVYSCGMILAAMLFGYSNLSTITVEHEQEKRYSLNNNFNTKNDVKLNKYGHLIPDIIYQMIQWKPYERISFKEIIATDWFKNISICTMSNESTSNLNLNVTNDEIIHTHLNIPGRKCKSSTE
ncbi:hypothetical protein BCR32DRAFT_291150 [Anaeromyces robustus]|uniref:Protein kinase domain-containing protein n=1 Tax=Anaeromyces robustus TaxID=1754192 RepID=A0A1Y1XG67_9FUNG|nr:hypothetical protein BCR32DRAFT_291150 [Anaeromyces robustus]|eukprot:ORX84692.1 hypothetical protein BCR32DRAFT_291150 [Anaeromyces robustus]